MSLQVGWRNLLENTSNSPPLMEKNTSISEAVRQQLPNLLLLLSVSLQTLEREGEETLSESVGSEVSVDALTLSGEDSLSV